MKECVPSPLFWKDVNMGYFTQAEIILYSVFRFYFLTIARLFSLVLPEMS